MTAAALATLVEQLRDHGCEAGSDTDRISQIRLLETLKSVAAGVQARAIVPPPGAHGIPRLEARPPSGMGRHGPKAMARPPAAHRRPALGDAAGGRDDAAVGSDGVAVDKRPRR